MTSPPLELVLMCGIAFAISFFFIGIPFAIKSTKSLDSFFYSGDKARMVAMKNGGIPFTILRSGEYGLVIILHKIAMLKYEYYFNNNKPISSAPKKDRVIVSIFQINGYFLLLCGLIYEFFIE